MIGSSAAAVISVGFGVQAFSIGVGGLPGIISIKSQFWLAFLAAMATAIIIPFVLTLIVGRKKLSSKKETTKAVKAEEVSICLWKLLKIRHFHQRPWETALLLTCRMEEFTHR